jgi:hypothetical protein
MKRTIKCLEKSRKKAKYLAQKVTTDVIVPIANLLAS